MSHEMAPEALAQLHRVIGNVVVCDTLEASLAQGGDDPVCIAAPDLMGLDGIAGLHQFVAGGYDHDGRLAAHAHTRHSGCRRDRDLRRIQYVPYLQQQRPLTLIAGSPVHVGSWNGCSFTVQRYKAIGALK
jgi:hypothetical protein